MPSGTIERGAPTGRASGALLAALLSSGCNERSAIGCGASTVAGEAGVAASSPPLKVFENERPNLLKKPSDFVSL